MVKHYPINFLDKSKEIPNSEELVNIIRQTNTLKYNRGNFLDYIIEMELIIDILIEDFMLHKKSNLRKVFRKNILNNRGVNLKQKIGLLLEILKEKRLLKEADLNLLNKNLNSLKDNRNRWAHGIIYFKQEKKGKSLIFQPYLNYINSEGNESEVTITNSYSDDLVLKLEATRKILVKVLAKRGFLPKNYLFKK